MQCRETFHLICIAQQHFDYIALYSFKTEFIYVMIRVVGDYFTREYMVVTIAFLLPYHFTLVICGITVITLVINCDMSIIGWVMAITS